MRTPLFTILLVIVSLAAQAQTGSIVGTVNSDQGEPLEFVNVAVKDVLMGLKKEANNCFGKSTIGRACMPEY